MPHGMHTCTNYGSTIVNVHSHRRRGACVPAVLMTEGVEEKIQLIILLILQAKLLKLPLLLLNGLNISACSHTGTRRIPGKQTLQLALIRLPLHRRRVILGQERSLGEPPSRERRRRKKTHWCIYRKMRPHNTLFGERIIKEARCAGARVPVFWLTLCRHAGPRMNQGWDAGITPWHTRRETALASCAHSPFAHEDTAVASRWKNGAMFWVRHPCCLTLGCRVITGECFFLSLYLRRQIGHQAASRPPAIWESRWRSFCKTKKADTLFGRANGALGIQLKISVSRLSASSSVWVLLWFWSTSLASSCARGFMVDYI